MATTRFGLFGRARDTLTALGGLSRSAYVAATRRSVPRVAGREHVRGAEDGVEIIRDRYGLPHVFARTARDALFGQGFVHAQDRLFQMEGMRRLAAGRLAEIGGAGSLRSDRLMRRIGLARAARRDVEGLRDEQRALVEAYAAGVNEGIRLLPALPPEFELIGGEPEPWRPEHTMLVGRLIMFSFAGNWDTELQRERLAVALGPEHAAALDPVHPPGAATATARGYLPAAERLLEAYRDAIEAGLPVGGGSNAWVVHGARSRSGAPLLASDPHVEMRIPGLFHASHVCGGELEAAGADLAGVPGIAIGHGRHVAWGITAGMANVSDCYIEEFDPDRPRHYRTPEGWIAAEEHVERIEVRGGEAVEERVLVTRHGPVVGPALPGERRAIALRSTSLEEGDLAGAFLGIARAGSLEEFEAALDAWPGTTFNFVFGTVSGRIGYRLVGDVPREEVGQGLLPQVGWASPGPPAAWRARELPRLIDPPSGVLVSANQAPGGELELGEEWGEPKRAERIGELLQAGGRHSAAGFARMQTDRRSEHLVRLRDLLLERGVVAEPEGPLLERWDGALSPRDPAAAIIGMAYEELARGLAQRAAGPLARIVLGVGLEGLNSHSSFHYRLQGSVVGATLEAAWPWFDGAADRDRQLVGAVTRAVEYLQQRFGENPREWHWGAIHPLALEHALHAVPGLGRWFSRGPFAFGGDINTVWQAGYAMHRPNGRTRLTAAYRQVIDLADFDRSTFVLATGNSGIPGHPRYDDCIEDYLAGRQRPLLFSRAAVEQAAEATLVLEPADAGEGGQ